MLWLAAGPPGRQAPLQLIAVPKRGRIVGRQAAIHDEQLQQEHVAAIAVGVRSDRAVAVGRRRCQLRRAIAVGAVGPAFGHGDCPIRPGGLGHKGVEVDQVQGRPVAGRFQVDHDIVGR